MNQSSVWVLAVALLLSLCLTVSGPEPEADAFATLPPGQYLALDDLAVDELAALKLRHLLSRDPVDVLLLGNSRPLPVGAAALGVAPDRFFNAALTGESLRSSIVLLDMLQAAGKAPRVALISFDNAELQYYSNPAWPRAGTRWREIAHDVRAGLTRPGIPLGEVARMVARHAVNEARLLTRRLSFSRVWWGVGVMARRLTGGDDDGYAPRHAVTGYGADGSRVAQVRAPYVPRSLPLANRNVLPGFLDYDLQRLAALAARGTRVVVYETPLHPGLVRDFLPQPSPVAAETRRALRELCTRHGLECHGATMLAGQPALPWPDEGHPPAEVLAATLRVLMDKAMATR